MIKKKLKDILNTNIQEICLLLNSIDGKTLKDLEYQSKKIAKTIKKKNKIIFFGNGGSSSDSDHLVTEFIVRFKKNRSSFPSISLSSNSSVITAIGNDYDFKNIFSRQIEGLARKGDYCIGLTTSGNSQNIIEAVKTLKLKKIEFMIWSGNNGGKIKNFTNKIFKINSKNTANIQIMHKFYGHIICEYIEYYLK